MKEAVVTVGPSGEGWLVEGRGLTEPLIFLSGAKAEAQAHALARSFAGPGRRACVTVHDRAQHIVGVRRYPEG